MFSCYIQNYISILSRSIDDNFDNTVSYIDDTNFKDKFSYGKNVLIGKNVSIGKNCKIGHNTIIRKCCYR